MVYSGISSRSIAVLRDGPQAAICTKPGFDLLHDLRNGLVAHTALQTFLDRGLECLWLHSRSRLHLPDRPEFRLALQGPRYRIARTGVGFPPVAGLSASGQFEMTTSTSISARSVT